MFKNYVPYAVVVLIGIGGIGFLVTNNTSSTATSALSDTSNFDNQEEISPVAREITPEEVESNVAQPDITSLAETPGTYQDYDPALVAASTADTIVLFFHATWCPSCRALHNDITNNLSAIPPGIEIYRADFDTHIELRRLNNVTLQHSVMIIGTDGTATSNISHPLNLSALLAGIQ